MRETNANFIYFFVFIFYFFVPTFLLFILHSTKGVSQKIVLVVNTAPGYVESAQENHRKFAVALLEKAKQICASRGVRPNLLILLSYFGLVII